MLSMWYKSETHSMTSFPSRIRQLQSHGVITTRTAVEASTFAIPTRAQAWMQTRTQIRRSWWTKGFILVVSRRRWSVWRCINAVFILAPPPGLEAPPSYDEVIRLPNQYPKLNSTAVTPVNENPPPTIAEIEANGHSITTITSSSPAVITSQQRNSTHRASVT